MSTSHNGNYTYPGTSVTIQITQDTPTVTTWPTYTGKTYKNLIDLSKISTTGVASVDGAFEFTGVSIDAGVATFTIEFTPTSSNYESVSKTDYTVSLTAVATYNSTNYYTIFDAVTAANDSTGGGTVWVIPNTSGDVIIDTDLTIDSDVTLILPYGEYKGTDDNSVRNKRKNSWGKDYESTETSGTLASDSNRVTYVILAEGKKITVIGTLEISGKLSGGSAGCDYSGQTSGIHAVLELRPGSSVVAEDKSVIKTYGFIKETTEGTAMVEIRSGATLYQPFVLRDFAGGAFFSETSSTMETYHNSPFNEWQIINVQSVMKIHSGGFMNIWANLYANRSHNSSEAQFIGNSSSYFIELKSGAYMQADYNSTTQVTKVEFSGGADVNSLVLSLAGAQASTQHVFFPINWMYDITLRNGTYEASNYRFKFMWGSKFTIESDATFNVKEANIYGDWRSYKNLKGNTPTTFDDLFISADGTANSAQKYAKNKIAKREEPAVFIVNGILNANNVAGTIKSYSTSSVVKIADATPSVSREPVFYYVSSWSSENNFTYVIFNSPIVLESYTKTENGVAHNNSVGFKKPGTAFISNSKWVFNEISITFNSNGGSDVSGITANLSGNGYNVGTLPIPTKAGYTFAGWYIDSGLVTEAQIVDGKFLNPTGDVTTLYAKWEAIEYTIEYVYVDSDGKAIEEYDFTTNGTFITKFTVESADIVIPTDLIDQSAKAYTFVGWYKVSNFIEANKIISSISAADLLSHLNGNTVTVYGLTTNISYVIHYVDDKYNEIADDNPKYTPNTIGSATIPTLVDRYSKTGDQYYFDKWQYSLDGKNYTDVLADNTITELLGEKTEIWIKAIWIQKATLNIVVSGTNSDTNHGMTHVSSSNNNTVYVPINTVYEYTLEDVTANNNKTNMKYYSTGWVYSGCSSATNGINVTSMTASVTVTWLEKETLIVNVHTYSGESGSDSFVNYTLTFFRNDTKYGNDVELTNYNENGEIKYYLIEGDQYQFSSVSIHNESTYNESNKTSDTLPREKTTIADGGITYHIWSYDKTSCIAAGTMITLADGTQKKVEDLLDTDILLVYDHERGEYVASPIVFIERDGWNYYNVIYLEYSNGVTNKLIYEHAMFDLTLNEYVYITEANYLDYVGHEFAYFNGESIESVTLENAYVKNEYTGCFSLVTAVHLNYFIDGMFSIPGGIEGIFNIFEYGEDLKYDSEQMQKDIETYGLYTYEDFAEYVPEEVFYAFQAQYFKVAVGKGMITFEEIIEMIDRYLVKNGVIE